MEAKPSDQPFEYCSGSSSEDEEIPTEQLVPGQRPVFERRSKDHAHFEEWLRGETAGSGGSSDTVDFQNREGVDARGYLHDPATQKIITNPREYQLELFLKAKDKNTIAVLNTGSGKTLIAALLLRHIIEEELLDREQGKDPRISFFLACCSLASIHGLEADSFQGRQGFPRAAAM
jgi:endoribonuclease Dicer